MLHDVSLPQGCRVAPGLLNDRSDEFKIAWRGPNPSGTHEIVIYSLESLAFLRDAQLGLVGWPPWTQAVPCAVGLWPRRYWRRRRRSCCDPSYCWSASRPVPDDTHSRYIEAAIGGVVVGCLYLPNGNSAP